jgi:hypothetical protein
MSCGAVSSAGEIIASVDDLVMWYLDLFSNHGTTSKVLSENSINQIIKPWTKFPETFTELSQGNYYGQGLFVTYPNGVNSSGWPTQIGHTGRTICANSAIFM